MIEPLIAHAGSAMPPTGVESVRDVLAEETPLALLFNACRTR